MSPTYKPSVKYGVSAYLIVPVGSLLPVLFRSNGPLLHLRLHRCRPAYTPTMIQRQTLAALLVLAAPACSLRFSSSAPTRRTAVAPAAQSAGLSTAARRQVLLSAAAVATVSALPPQRALATCSCPKGFDSCVCTDDDGPATSSTNKKRADAAGRDAQASQADIAEMREMYGDEPKKASKPSKPSKTSNGGASSTSRSAAPAQLGAPMATPVMPEYAGLSGGGSMNYNEGENECPAYVMQRSHLCLLLANALLPGTSSLLFIHTSCLSSHNKSTRPCAPAPTCAVDKNQARQRFLKIVADTVAKREAEFGFELDLDDIKQVESVLRNKYCGPQGLIGPC